MVTTHTITLIYETNNENQEALDDMNVVFIKFSFLFYQCFCCPNLGRLGRLLQHAAGQNFVHTIFVRHINIVNIVLMNIVIIVLIIAIIRILFDSG